MVPVGSDDEDGEDIFAGMEDDWVINFFFINWNENIIGHETIL